MPRGPMKSSTPIDRFPKGRIDALNDGIFAFAMTLLVLDVRVPLGFSLDSADALTAHLVSLWRQIAIYVLSFFVLANLWRASIARRPRREHLTGTVLNLWLAYMFFVTMVPFSSGLVGRYGEFQPAVIVYSLNMITLACLVIAIRYLESPANMRAFGPAAGIHLPVFIATALLAMAISFFEPRHSMFAYFLNFASYFRGWVRTREVARRWAGADTGDTEPGRKA